MTLVSVLTAQNSVNFAVVRSEFETVQPKVNITQAVFCFLVISILVGSALATISTAYQWRRSQRQSLINSRVSSAMTSDRLPSLSPSWAEDETVLDAFLRRVTTLVPTYVLVVGVTALTYLWASRGSGNLSTYDPGDYFQYNPNPYSTSVDSTFLYAFIAAVLYVAIGATVISRTERRRRRRTTLGSVPDSDNLAERVEQVQTGLIAMSEALGGAFSNTTKVVEALQSELLARVEVLEKLTAEATSAQREADQAQARAKIALDSAEGVDALIDRRRHESEAAGRKWDLKLFIYSLIGAGAIGYCVAVLAAHFG